MFILPSHNGLTWLSPRPIFAERLGLIPDFLSAADPRPAREQLHTAYAHGGGWQPFFGFELKGQIGSWWLDYPEDPPIRLVAWTQLRDEYVALFAHDWLAIIGPDSWEVARFD